MPVECIWVIRLSSSRFTSRPRVSIDCHACRVSVPSFQHGFTVYFGSISGPANLERLSPTHGDHTLFGLSIPWASYVSSGVRFPKNTLTTLLSRASSYPDKKPPE